MDRADKQLIRTLDPAPSVTFIIPALLFGFVIAIPLWLWVAEAS